MKTLVFNFLGSFRPVLARIGGSIVWGKFLLVFTFIVGIIRLLRDKSWRVFSAYFVILIVNLLIFGILQTEQIKENSKIFFNETNWIKWIVFIFSICSFVFANHLALLAVKKYTLDDSSPSYKILNQKISIPTLASILITSTYIIYINRLISAGGARPWIFSIIVSFIALWFIVFLLSKTSSFINTSVWNFFDYFSIVKLKLTKTIPAGIKKDLWFKLSLLFIGSTIYLLLTVIDGEQKIAGFFSSQSIIFFGFAFFILFYVEFIVIPKVNQTKFFTIALLISMVFSIFNEPTAPQYLTRESERQNYKAHFRNWVSNKSIPENRILPVVFIAAEGGGIRAMSWTLLSLEFLAKEGQIKDFNEYLYCISGVSGGAVGGMFYVSMLKDKLFQKHNKITDSTTTDLIVKDYLSDLVRGNVFRSPVRLFAPFKAPFLDRNKMLENSWSAAYSDLTECNTLNNPFLELWSSDKNYDVPSLVLNGTFAETGQKAIISNINFSDSTNRFLINNVIDVYSLLDTQHDLPTKTAASLAARFPLITSGGLIDDVNGKKSGHITDGGYHDNTGLETCIQIINLLKPEIESIETEKGIDIKPIIYFLKNGMNMDNEKIIKAATYSYETQSMIGSFYNSWDRGAEIKNSIYSDLLNQSKSDIGYVLMELKRKKGDFPLGWQLSKESAMNMKNILKETYGLTNVTADNTKAVRISETKLSLPQDSVGVNNYRQTMLMIREAKKYKPKSLKDSSYIKRLPSNTLRKVKGQIKSKSL